LPTIYLRKELYDLLVRQQLDVTEYVNHSVEESLNESEEREENSGVLYA